MRIGATQTDISDAVGAAKRTIIDWEKDRTSPTAIHLLALSKIGVDVVYVLTGERKRDSSDEEKPISSVLSQAHVDLMGRILEEVTDAYGAAGVRISIRNIGQVAAQIHNDIVLALGEESDQTERTAALKMAIQQLRRKLSAPAQQDSKRSA
ncbi:MAG: hypothetical protein RBR34_10705 [Rhodospirillaceae bacterium]|nr:hypothetical protein [Rhodospirillaceae bacterium]